MYRKILFLVLFIPFFSIADEKVEIPKVDEIRTVVPSEESIEQMNKERVPAAQSPAGPCEGSGRGRRSCRDDHPIAGY